jgi:DNA-directed RNA polymerase specialized sigma24 family protein
LREDVDANLTPVKRKWLETPQATFFVDFHQPQTTIKRKTEVTMGQAKHITRAAAYADRDDFRHIFDENMNSLYLLAFLLTADHGKAEQCFVSGLEDAVGGNPVFKEWAHSWARRVIIQNAVRLISPRPDNGSGHSRSASLDSEYKRLPAERHVEVSAVLGLEPLDRIVYVMTVLEHYSDHECSLLLGCARRDVLPARTRALEEIGRQVEMQDRQPSNFSAQDPGLHDGPGPLIELMAVPPFVTST